MSVTYKFPHDSPIRYLPLVYMLPYDLLVRCPTLRKLPRSMGALNTSEWGEVIGSAAFYNEIMDAVASLAFPHFGFGGWKEHYTGWCPVWRLSYALPLWAKGVERVRGWGLQALFALPPNYEIPFFDPEDVKAVMAEVVQQTIEEQGWGPMLEVVREMPCDEDFEKWDTNVRKDFLRKWYHTRSKRVQTVSLEECMEDEDSKIHALPAPDGDFTEQVEGEDFYKRFKATLSEKDMAILELRVDGYGYQEIADRLGYKTHSAVVKRMEAIKKRFIQYENETGRGFSVPKIRKKVRMFPIKDLPPVERRADGSLYRMDAGQRREAVRLIKGRCSYYDGGNCLYLDDGEEVTCPQSISYSVCCKFFRHVLLKDEAGRGLEAAVFRREAPMPAAAQKETFQTLQRRGRGRRCRRRHPVLH